ncbi:SulP family inorganic anion transporter [Mesorhizobium sp. M0833]|uniref:SulP family inorganic anion transporter n=1 Tax=Mesorhizobium sp. M0833 TaxID=2957009 RepID=UPI003334F9E2
MGLLAQELTAGVTTAGVALPMCVSSGVLALSPLGADRVAEGALAGVIAAIAGGVVASAFQRSFFVTTMPSNSLIQASLLGSLLVALDGNTTQALLAFVGCVMLTGLWMILIGATGLARIVKLAPHPVVAGFVSGVGILVIKSQMPMLLAVSSWSGIVAADFSLATITRLPFGLALIAAMAMITRHAPKVPALLAGLIIGYVIYHAARLWAPDIELGPVIGSIDIEGWAPVSMIEAASTLRLGLKHIWWTLIAGSLTLAIVGTLDTVFTLRTARNLADVQVGQDRALVGLGIANLVSPLMGGLFVSTSAALTVANYRAGGRMRTSTFASRAVLLAAILAFPDLIFSMPLVVLSAILVFVGINTIDRWALRTARQALLGNSAAGRTQARRNMAVVAAVALATVLGQPVVGAVVGVALACIVFMIEMNRPVVRRKEIVGKTRSRRIRSTAQTELLAIHERELAVLELQGVLFFGNADELAEEIDRLPSVVRVIILDFRAVSDVDASGALTLQQISARCARRGQRLFFSDLRDAEALEEFTSQSDKPNIYPDLEAALERFEEEIVERTDSSARSVIEVPLGRTDFGMTMAPEDLKVLMSYLDRVEFPRGTVLCRAGDQADRLWMLTRGCISVWVDAPGGRRRLASIGAGCTVGEMGFLTERPRSTDVIADEDVVAYELTSSAANKISKAKPHIAQAVLRSIARQLSDRLRNATEDLRVSHM